MASALSKAADESPAPTRERFGDSLRHPRSGGLAVIAEIKRKSPSRGDITSKHLDVAETARMYEDGGAAAISVLTDSARFGALRNDMNDVRDACSLPILRKDFLRAVADVEASREMGADAVLLIVADLSLEQLVDMLRAAEAADLDALVEVRNRDEIRRAEDAGAKIIAVNQRANPASEQFTVDYGCAVTLADYLPDRALKVAASGIGVNKGTEPADIIKAGYAAALVGESLLAALDPSEAVAAIRSGKMPQRVPLCPFCGKVGAKDNSLGRWECRAEHPIGDGWLVDRCAYYSANGNGDIADWSKAELWLKADRGDEGFKVIGVDPHGNTRDISEWPGRSREIDSDVLSKVAAAIGDT